MKKLIMIVVLLVLICSCSTSRMTSSIWCTVEPVQNHNQEGLKITSLYMFEDGKVDIYQSIVTDSNLVVAPFLFARGRYTIAGNLRKEAGISLSGTNKKQEIFDWSGLIDLKKKSMLLTGSDSTANIYYKYGNIAIQQK